MVNVLVSFDNGTFHYMHDVSDDTRMHEISARIRADRGLPAVKYADHSSFLYFKVLILISELLNLIVTVTFISASPAPIADQQLPHSGANVQTEIIRMSETSTVAEALILTDEVGLIN